MRNFILLLFFVLGSCSHFIVDTETRIQIENRTETALSDFSLLSQNGAQKILVSDTIEPQEKSKVYESEFVGEFRLAVFAEGELHDLGVHELKGGSVLVQILPAANIDEADKKFEIQLKYIGSQGVDGIVDMFFSLF